MPMVILALVRSYKMTVTYIEYTNAEGVNLEYAIIDRGNGEFTSMLKSTYDAMIASQNEA
jgi:hypothetical protein